MKDSTRPRTAFDLNCMMRATHAPEGVFSSPLRSSCPRTSRRRGCARLTVRTTTAGAVTPAEIGKIDNRVLITAFNLASSFRKCARVMFSKKLLL